MFRREDGTVSTDWVILTALMLGTAFGVVNTLGGDFEEASAGAALRGVAVQRGFASRSCPAGVDGVQAREDARVAAGGTGRVDVVGMISTARYRTDADVIAEHADLTAAVAARATDAWTRDRTLLAALSCELVLRGLAG